MAAKLIPTDRKVTFRAFVAHLKTLGCKNSDVAFLLSVSERQVESWLWDADKEPDDAACYLMRDFCRNVHNSPAEFNHTLASDVCRIAQRNLARVYRMAARLKQGKSPIGQKAGAAGRKSIMHESATHGEITVKRAAEISGHPYHTIASRMRSGKNIDEAMQ